MEEKNKSRGLGDTIKKITEFLGIPQCEECKQRQQLFNELVPYTTEFSITQADADIIQSYLDQEPLKVYCVKLNDYIASIGGPNSTSCFCTS